MTEELTVCAWCDAPHPTRVRVCPFTGLTIRAAGEGRAASSTAADLLGQAIDDRYLLRSVIGEGGMGSVFDAADLKIGRAMAVKVLHASQAKNRVVVHRFHREARAAAAIGHPNICEVYDFGALTDGRPYIVMERLTGETLAQRIARSSVLECDDVVVILSQVLAGLAAAHEKGIVHRDIKPENVFLIGSHGRATQREPSAVSVKLLDFGVSKVIDPDLRPDEPDLTKPGMVMGTPHYMSPEQARGERNLDERVDLYACGVMLYEALAGQRPFSAESYDALLLQILSASPTPVRALRPGLPGAFEAVIERAMAPDRRDRYATAGEFQSALLTLRACVQFGGGSRPPPSHEPYPVVRDDPGVARAAGLRRLPKSPFVASVQTPSSVDIPIIFASETTPTAVRPAVRDEDEPCAEDEP